MIYSQENLQLLCEERDRLQKRHQSLMLLFSDFKFIHEKSSEYAKQGLLRRINTLARCIDNIYTIYPPQRKDRPNKNELYDLGINLQAFIFNVSGSIDNLLWILVIEKSLVTDEGNPPNKSEVSLNSKFIKKSLSLELPEFKKYLDGHHKWFEYIKDYRDALAHRIPIYVPPFCLNKEEAKEWNQLYKLQFEALFSQQFDEIEKIETKMESIGNFLPIMKQ